MIRTKKSRKIWAWHVARIRDERNALRLLVEKPEGKRPQGRPRRRRADNIKMNLRRIGWGGMDWNYLVQYRGQWWTLLDTVTNLRVQSNIRKFFSED
jgi:hypothetical protein